MQAITSFFCTKDWPSTSWKWNNFPKYVESRLLPQATINYWSLSQRNKYFLRKVITILRNFEYCSFSSERTAFSSEKASNCLHPKSKHRRRRC
jgi:hypothetical protein